MSGCVNTTPNFRQSTQRETQDITMSTEENPGTSSMMQDGYVEYYERIVSSLGMGSTLVTSIKNYFQAAKGMPQTQALNTIRQAFGTLSQRVSSNFAELHRERPDASHLMNPIQERLQEAIHTISETLRILSEAGTLGITSNTFISNLIQRRLGEDMSGGPITSTTLLSELIAIVENGENQYSYNVRLRSSMLMIETLSILSGAATLQRVSNTLIVEIVYNAQTKLMHDIHFARKTLMMNNVSDFADRYESFENVYVALEKMIKVSIRGVDNLHLQTSSGEDTSSEKISKLIVIIKAVLLFRKLKTTSSSSSSSLEY